MLFIPTEAIKVEWESPTYRVGKLKKQVNYTERGKMAAQFDGVNTALDFVQKYMQTAQSHKSSSNRGRGSTWTEFDSYSKWIEVCTKTPEKVRRFSEKDTMLGGGDADGLEVSYDVTGDFIDVGRVLSGEPEVFGSMYDGKPRGRRMNIILNINWGSAVGQSDITARSKRIVRLVDWLETQGVRTQIVAVDSNDQVHIEIMVKRYDDPLNLNDVALVSHGDWLRRIGFRIREYSEDLSGSYGSSVSFREHMANFKPQSLPDYDEQATYLHIGSRTDSIDYSFNQLEEQLEGLLDSSHERHDQELANIERHKYLGACT